LTQKRQHGIRINHKQEQQQLINHKQEEQHGGKVSLANTSLFTPMLHIYSTMGDATS
jgi:hypothetical protein